LAIDEIGSFVDNGFIYQINILLTLAMALFLEPKQVCQETLNGTMGSITIADRVQLLAMIEKSEEISTIARAAMEAVDWIIVQIQLKMKQQGEVGSQPIEVQDWTAAKKIAIHAVQTVGEALDQFWKMTRMVMRMADAFKASIEEAKAQERAVQAINAAFLQMTDKSKIPMEMSPDVTPWSGPVTAAQLVIRTWIETSNEIDNTAQTIHKAANSFMKIDNGGHPGKIERVLAVRAMIAAGTVAKEKAVAAAKSFEIVKDQIHSIV
jgi:hypothetical protein